MTRVAVWTLALGFLAAALAPAQDEKFQSGLQPAAVGKPFVKMPHSIEAHVFNGKNADRFHCFVCENDIHPTVLLFLKEPAEGKDKALEALFGKLDDLVEKYQAMEKYPDVTFLQAYAIFLSPAAQTSLSLPQEDDPGKLVKEATDRRALYRRMREWAGKTKKVIVGCALPEAVKGYKINPAASLTGLYYDSLNVQENFAYQDFTEADVEPMIQRIEARLQGKITAYEASRKKSPLRKKT